MRELSGLDHALSQVGATWNPDRVEASLGGFYQKRARRARRRAAIATVGVLALIAGVYVWSEQGASQVAETGPDAPAPGADPGAPTGVAGAIALGDRSTVTPDDDADIDVVHDSPERVEVRVKRGRGRFRVDENRAIRVIAGDVAITVQHSEFSVAHASESVEVWAHRGHVTIAWQSETFELAAGEHRRFARPEPAAPSDRARRPRRDRVDWRALAQGGQFDDAYEALRNGGKVKRRVADLMLAADVYRMTDHPRQAAKMLRRVTDKFSRDPRAPLAAFTLGRVLLDDLGQPASAARAFATARRAAPRGPLAEDALAREVEAWSRAGKRDKARALAERYLDAYPRGHRVRAVKKYGGL